MVLMPEAAKFKLNITDYPFFAASTTGPDRRPLRAGPTDRRTGSLSRTDEKERSTSVQLLTTLSAFARRWRTFFGYASEMSHSAPCLVWSTSHLHYGRCSDQAEF